MLPISQRTLFLTAFLLCCALIAAALYFQYVQGMDPCPLCIMQRIAVMGLGGIALLGTLHNPHTFGRRCYGLAMLLIAGIGAAIAGRHVWLQHLPADQVPSCGPGLEYILETLPLHEAFTMILKGSGECAETHWSLLGLSIPGWMFVIFSGFIVFGLYLLLRPATEPPATTPS